MTIRRLFRRRYAPPGSAPGAITIAPDARPPVINVFSYAPGEIEEKHGVTPDEAFAMVREGRVAWIDVVGLGDEALLRRLGELFEIHPLALSDVVHIGQRPKAEDYGGDLFIILRMPHFDDDGDIGVQEQTSLFLGRGYALTFQERPGDCFEPLRDRLRRGKGLLRTSGADYLACMIIDSVVDAYFPLLESLGETLEQLEEEVIQHPGRQTLAEVFRAKRELMNVRRAVWPQRDMLAGLLRDRHALITADVIPYLRDAYDHAIHIVDVTETFRELAGSFVDVYLSSVSNRTNAAMRFLTVIATIFIPLTFLVGVYGMNFDPDAGPLSMPELNWGLSYPLFWIFTILFLGAALLIFRRLGWLGVRN